MRQVFPISCFQALFFIAVYGDIIKYALTPAFSNLLLYFILFIVMSAIFLTPNARAIDVEIIYLLFIMYIIVVIMSIFAFMSFPQQGVKSLSYLIYFCIPVFTLNIAARKLDFAFYQKFKRLLILSLPIVFIAIVQKFYDQSFLVNSSYSSDSALILRNLFDGSFFVRYPSIYASADRFSGVCMCLVIMAAQYSFYSERKSEKFIGGVLIILFTVGLLIAGARSRILVLIIPVIIGLFFGFFIMLKSKKIELSVILLVLSLFISFFATMLDPLVLSVFEVTNMIADTIVNGDVVVRLLQAYVESFPTSTDAFNFELGADANGKPGEFMLRSFSVDIGIFGRNIFLFLHILVLLQVCFIIFRYVLERDFPKSLLSVFLLIYLLLGFTAGVTGIYEFSSAILFFGFILPIGMLRNNDSNRRVS